MTTYFLYVFWEGCSFSKHSFVLFWLCLVGLLSLLLPSTTGVTVVMNCAELQALQNNLTDSYQLGMNINCSETIHWNEGQGFEPIGDDITPFEGILDGRGHTVSSLFIYQPSTYYVGLFGRTRENARIIAIVLSEMDIVGGYRVGSLVGHNDGLITNVTSSGFVLSVSTYDQVYVGGLVGYSSGFILNVLVNGSVSSTATGVHVRVGGLVGYSSGFITNAVVMGSVLNMPRVQTALVGGLTGHNDGLITNVTATNSVSSTGDYDYVGGLVGYNYYSSIVGAYATGSVTTGNGLVGGLVGYNFYSSVSDAYATGVVTTNSGYVGGLIGINYGTITNVYATGLVMSAGSYVAGLIGLNAEGSVTNAYATGDVLCTTTGRAVYVGGLIGLNEDSSITNAYATGLVMSTAEGAYVGGLVGLNDPHNPMVNVTATGSVSSTGGSSYVGGLVGDNDGSINDAMAIGSVFGDGDDTEVGGLVGRNGGTINHAMATGSVLCDGQGTAIGGLVGYNSHGFITNAFTAGAVSSNGEAAEVGGLVGNNRGSLVNISTTSVVLGTGRNVLVGGLVAYNRGSITNASVASLVMGGDYVGGLVGLNSGTIFYATATGSVSGNQTVGGLIGSNDVDAFITHAFTNNSVSGKSQVGGLVGANHGSINVVYSLSHVTGDDNVGGLIGLNSGGSVIDAYVIGVVTGQRYVGGIAGNVGILVEQISKIYVSGCIDGQAFVGALVGGSLDSGLIHTVYWDKEVTLHDQASGSSANFDLRKNKKDTQELYKKATYVDWDFNNTWSIDEGHGYPYLKSLPPAVLPVAPEGSCPQTTAYIWIFFHTILIPAGAALAGLVAVCFPLFHWYQRSTSRKKINQVSYLLPILAKLGRLPLVKLLCDVKANNIDQNTIDHVLMVASEAGRKEVVSYLLEQYKNPSQLNEKTKKNAAQTAYTRGYFAVATLLVPNESEFQNTTRLNELQNQLFLALENYPDPWFAVRSFGKKGVSVNALNPEDHTPVMLAIKNKHFDEALLLAHQFSADVLMTNHKDETVIDQLLEKHKVIEARQLLNANHVMDYYRAVYIYTLQQVKSGKIKEIDLSKLLLNDDDLLELAEACLACQDIQSLNLSYNAITSSGVLYLVKIILQRQTQLKTLDLRHTLISFDDVNFLKRSLVSTANIQVDERFNETKHKGSDCYVPVFSKAYFEALDLRLTVMSLHFQRYHVLIALAFLLEMLNKLFDLLLIESLWVNKQYDLAYVSIACLLAETLLGLYGFRASHGYWFPHDWREGWRVLLLPIASPQLVHLEWGISFVNPQFARLKLANFCVDELLQTVIILIFFIRKGIKIIALIKLIFSLVTSIFFMVKMFYYAPVLREQFARWRQRHPWWVLDNRYQRQKLEEELR